MIAASFTFLALALIGSTAASPTSATALARADCPGLDVWLGGVATPNIDGSVLSRVAAQVPCPAGKTIKASVVDLTTCQPIAPAALGLTGLEALVANLETDEQFSSGKSASEAITVTCAPDSDTTIGVAATHVGAESVVEQVNALYAPRFEIV